MQIGIALEGAGWHPAAWREPEAQPGELFSARYWVDVVTEAERGLADFVTIEDGLGLQSTLADAPDGRVDQVRGRLDAGLIAARVAPLTRSVGLIPTVIATHTEPFHASKAIATLDYVSTGRAGVRIKVSARPDEAAHFGRRDLGKQAPAAMPADASPPASRLSGRQQAIDLLDEAADYVEVLRRLWDSWDDYAEIRHVASGRFVDRDKLHYINFQGRWFSVKGPSITPRPPQGQPLVAALGHNELAYWFIGRSADLAFVTPRDEAQAAAAVAGIRAAQAAVGRAQDSVHVLADLLVFLDDEPGRATARKARLDELAGTDYPSDAATFTGTPAQLADVLSSWAASSGLSGFRLRPGTIPQDLTTITRALVPELQRRGLFRSSYEASTLRGHFGLPRPANRYAA
jgi:alkanesulfonate monooxygenase SsuD/methylene tetrahydromethanopterin reductase-like flavin-dependent oxidoreductase (luciferase family)